MIKIRWNESKTPLMNGHMRLEYRIRKYVKVLPKTRRNMMFKIRKRFIFKRSKEGLI